MRFKSPTDKPVMLALLTGHTAVVGPEYADLDARFHREAIANGCLPAGVGIEEAEASPGFNRATAIKDAMEAMLNGSEEGDFTGDGKPDVRKLSARVGFTVERSERDALWAEFAK